MLGGFIKCIFLRFQSSLHLQSHGTNSILPGPCIKPPFCCGAHCLFPNGHVTENMMLSCGIKQQCYLLLHVHGKACPVNLPLVSALAWSLVSAWDSHSA